MKKKYLWLIITFSIGLMFSIGFFYQYQQKEKRNQYIVRSQVSKSIALAFTTKEECETADIESWFSEKDQSSWYVKYMDYLYEQQLLSKELTEPTAKGAGGSFTYAEAKWLFQQLNVDSSVFEEEFREGNLEKPVSKETWWDMYEYVKEASPAGNEVRKKEIILYGTPSNLENAGSWEAYTDQEILGFEGIVLTPYIDQKIEVWIRGSDIIGVLKVLETTVIYENLWITDSGEGKAQVFLNGASRTFPVKKLEEDYGGTLADFEVSGGEVTKIRLKRETIKGKVLLASEEGIEIEGYGLVPLSEKFHIYKMYGELAEQQLSDIIVGYDSQEFIVADGKLCGAITKEAADAATIRVLLTTSGFQSIFHDVVKITSTAPFDLSYGETTEHYEGGSVVEFNRENPAFLEGRMKVLPSDENEIQILSLERSLGNPAYSGILEFSLASEGILIVNELTLEAYLTKVIPSEMPASFGLEALKAQAVCARSYGYKQIQNNAYSAYGAHVDDSTKFQVYNNLAPQEITLLAVSQTYGQVLSYQGEVVNAYYFATSCGATTDTGIWGSGPEEYPYLSGEMVTTANAGVDLSGEDNFYHFIKNTEYASFDKNASLYRWHTDISLEGLEKKIPGIGSINSLEVTKRGTNGIVMELVIHGSNGTKILENQSEVRSVLGDSSAILYKNDGTSTAGWDQLPSAFLVLEPKYQESILTGYTIYGGGYGHGVGMSQNAAAAMGKAGMTYVEILDFFYQGAEIGTIQD